MELILNLTPSDLTDLKIDIYNRMKDGSFAPFCGIDKLATDVIRLTFDPPKPPTDLDAVMKKLVNADLMRQTKLILDGTTNKAEC